MTKPILTEKVTIARRESKALSETEEILNNPEAMESLEKAQEDLNSGKYAKWEEVKQEV
ncbi:MAG: hypothetical protein OXT74_10570 [Candidatus Poribacteria bacterium]|nr:hypothetical protein [Candidatus Poribacteria bacterium]